MVDYSTIMLYNVLTVRNLLPVCFKRLQGQLLRLTTLRCRDEATRTPDPYVPNVVRYQLRYIPLALEKPAAKVLQIFELRAVLQKKICCYEKKGLTL